MKLFYKQTFRISRLSKIYRAFRWFTGFKNDTCNAFITKIKEPRVQTQFLVAGVERFELPDDGVRVRSLTAWRHPNILFRPIDFASCTRRICFANASIHAAEHSKRAPQSTFLFYTLSFFFASVLIRFWKKFFISV